MDHYESVKIGDRAHYVRSPTPWLAGCSDLGRHHKTNQDALALATNAASGYTVAAVSDGVSTAFGAEAASSAATQNAIAALMAGIDDQEPAEALEQAFRAAQDAVVQAKQSDDVSACTLVAAVITPDAITIANVGDSRAYWIGDDGSCEQLTTDDSMAQARIMLGMSREEAEQSAQAHSLTRWLGRNITDPTPTVSHSKPAGGGWLLLCSDGLWNYASAPSEIQPVVAHYAAQCETVSQLSESLVAWANDQGGHDNITAVVCRFPH